MIHIKPLIVAAAIAFGSCLQASAKTTQLTIRLKDGRSIVLDLTATGNDENKQMPVMTFTPTTVQVVLPAKESSEPDVTAIPAVYTFEIKDLQSMEPIEAGTSAITDILSTDNSLIIAPIGGDLVRVTGNSSLKAEAIKVYDIAGREHSVDIISDGSTSLTLSLAQLQPGVYIVNISSHSLKITKR